MISIGTKHKTTPVSFKRDFTILMIGQMEPNKGFDIAVKSFNKLLSKFAGTPHIKLILLGDGPQRSFIDDLIERLNIKEYTTVYSSLSEDEISALYKKATVFLYPSYGNGGFIMAEALRYGLPVICFDNNSTRDYADSSCSLKIPSSSYFDPTRMFSRAMFKLLIDTDTRKQMSRNARKRFKDHVKDQFNSKTIEITTLRKLSIA